MTGRNFVFCTDITQHINELKIDLQVSNHLIDEMFENITELGKNLRLWELQMRSKIMKNFPFLRTGKPTHAEKYP
jgi:hypothetical protein